MVSKTAKKWADLAWKAARKRAGAAWDLLGSDLRHALVTRELVVLFAAQEHANGEHMRAAAQLVLETEAAPGPEYDLEHPYSVARP